MRTSFTETLKTNRVSDKTEAVTVKVLKTSGVVAAVVTVQALATYGFAQLGESICHGVVGIFTA